MGVVEMVEELLERHNYEDWEVVDDVLLICPCGDEIEYDGECASGHQSPLIKIGLI